MDYLFSDSCFHTFHPTRTTNWLQIWLTTCFGHPPTTKSTKPKDTMAKATPLLRDMLWLLRFCLATCWSRFFFITMLLPLFILNWMPWNVSQTCGCDLYASACCSKLCLMCASFSGSMCLVICIEFCAFSLLLPRPWSQNFHVRPQAVVSNLQKPSPPPKRLQV